jgi:NAD(P)-dependent dehydrogenase (short-subunit alcohol dehydrogenase family)
MGKTYLVTGACGGLGRAVTAMLADRGGVVFAADIDTEALAHLCESERVHPLFLDVTDPSSARRAKAEVQESASSLDGIVCAAGVYVGGPLLDASEKDVRRALDVNALGAFLVVKELFPLLREGSRVILVSSESTRAAMPFTGPYVMSKRALEAYGETLRRELLPLGIRVTVIQPGAIRTPLLDSAAKSLTGSSSFLIYRTALQNAATVLEKEMRTGMEPQRVARVITQALESRGAMRVRRIGNDHLRGFLSRLPAGLIDALVRKFL